MKKNSAPWWTEEYGYFGSFYIKADTLRDVAKNKELNVQKRTLREIDGVVNLLNLKKGEKILDCPCGYGRHSIELTTRGFSVIGTDINLKHLQKAKECSGKLNVIFKKENMNNLKYTSEFDAVINMFASFGFFETEEENEKVLKGFFDALKPGGKFLMHIDINISKIIHIAYKHTSEKKLLTGEILEIIDEYDQNTKKLNGSWTIRNGSKKETRCYSVRIYTKDEFENMCKKIGFSSVRTYSNWCGDEYSDSSNDMIVIAQK